MVAAVSVARPAPWEKVPAQDQLFVMITGANSGVGLGIAQRLIDDFLATRSPTSHLILMPTTRSAQKSLETIRTLRTYVTAAAQNPSDSLRSRVGGEAAYRWEDTAARVHVLCLSLDLCDLRGVYAFADGLCGGTVSNPPGLDGEYLTDVRVPRLDSVIYNAAYGGWTGVNWLGAIKCFFTRGLMETATYPDFKNTLPTCLLNENSRYGYPAKPLLGEVFTACTFGHYCLAHRLMPLLGRSADSPLAPGRIIWSSSLEAHADTFSADDLQCFNRPVAYESAKRLTDLLCLTQKDAGARPYMSTFFSTGGRRAAQSVHSDSDTAVEDDDFETADELAVRPRMYLTHPGIVASTLFPLPDFLFWLYEFVVLLCRWIGSPWHNVTGYRGGAAPAWIAIESQSALDAADAERTKWGSACDRLGVSCCKATEVNGYGWRGEVEDPRDDETPGPRNMRRGRRAGAVLASEESLDGFRREGAACWGEMERLRREWEGALGL